MCTINEHVDEHKAWLSIYAEVLASILNIHNYLSMFLLVIYALLTFQPQDLYCVSVVLL